MDAKTLVSEIDGLPPTPQILPKLMKLLRDQESSLYDLVALIQMDAALTAQVVKLSNSAYFGMATPAENLEDAINRMGFQEVYRVVGAIASAQLLNRPIEAYGMEKGELWQNSVAGGICMRVLADLFEEDQDSAYTLGLLHALGKVVINQFYLEKGIEIYDPEEGGTVTPELERTVLGFDHAEVGGKLLEKWKFPEESSIPVEYQLKPFETEKHRKMACMLAVARWAIPRILETKDEDDLEPIPPDLAKFFEMGDEEVNDLLSRTRLMLEEISEIFQAIA